MDLSRLPARWGHRRPPKPTPYQAQTGWLDGHSLGFPSGTTVGQGQQAVEFRQWGRVHLFFLHGE